ncbi:MAG: polyribonucleotide nucleotidyltransferase [Bacteroidetes bacterium]|nr:polyribonucleotide nucleotidyltransferase [Bacteroidota bacterium]
MASKIITKTIKYTDGKDITIETGKLARQADGSVVIRQGNTMLLATVVSPEEAREGASFLPLSVDYQEKFASSGKIPGGFLKREGRLSDHEILICRLVDRALRPLFPDEYYSDIQVMISLISADDQIMPDSLAALAASSALAVSDIPFDGPISEVRVARVENKMIVNPTQEEKSKSDLDIIVAATIDNIMMVEGEMKEVEEEVLLEALHIAHEAIKEQCKVQIELAEEVGVTKRGHTPPSEDEALENQVRDALYEKFYEVFKRHIIVKSERSAVLKTLKDDYLALFEEDEEANIELIKKYIRKVEKEAARNLVLDTKVRMDGRKPDEIRPIWSEASYLPSPHGSAVFTRGETQSLSTVTLGTKLDEQIIDGAVFSGSSKFILHYNFPAFSTGEARPNRGPGRREVGHANLAYRALKAIMPDEEENPYTIRIVSDILESNGSSSMATVCASCLALMDAGIQISKPVSGIAMGMISEGGENGRYAILSDILGDEDHLGDMDFKITGTEKGITACQMDIKIDGLSYKVLKEALDQARKGRIHILNEMKKTLAVPREDLKPNAPRCSVLTIEKDMIGAVIGPGGKVVQEIQADTGATVIIEEVDNAGKVSIFSSDKKSMEDALKRIKSIVAVPVVGEVYDGIVKSVVPFGAFVEFMPGKEALLHISEIKWERIEKIDGVLEVGEEIKVKLIGIDNKSGKLRLSRKVLLPRPEKSRTAR